MTTAKELFVKHEGEFKKIYGNVRIEESDGLIVSSILYAACILAETIENRLQSEKNKF